MKGDRLLKVLEIIEKGSINFINLAAAFAATSKQESLRQLYSFKPASEAPMTEALRLKLKERRRAAAYISFLKKDGLITAVNGHPKLTVKGLLKLGNLKKSASLRLPVKDYLSEKSRNVLLVAFDVPEKKKNYRNWLRSAIKKMGLKMIQKSVWLGKVKIPKEFIDDLHTLKLLEHVEILEVNKSGSLNRLV